MQLSYTPKRSREEIIEQTPCAVFRSANFAEACRSGNLLIQGDNAQVMKTLLTDHDMAGTVDLVYIDPPFSTNQVYKHHTTRTQTVSASAADDVAYSDTLTGTRFLDFLRERLVLLNELLSPNGSIYLHIDYKIGHYVKVIMDEVFGAKNFRNDITRIKCNPKNFTRKGYGNIKDLILFYAKGEDFCWNEPAQVMTETDILRLFPKVDAAGRRYTTTPLHAPGETRNGETGQKWKGLSPPRGRHWRYKLSVLDALDEMGLIEWSSSGNPRKIIYADEATTKGKRLQDIWEFKDPQYPQYPTEKSIDLLRTIIRTSSRPGDLVMDCFCGSGTALVAAQELGRRWIGIDSSAVAINICRSRLNKVQPGLFQILPAYVYADADSACATAVHAHETQAEYTASSHRRLRKPKTGICLAHTMVPTAAPPKPRRQSARKPRRGTKESR